MEEEGTPAASTLARARCRATLAWLPQVRMSHQRRLPLGERSTKTSRQPSLAQIRNRSGASSATKCAKEEAMAALMDAFRIVPREQG